VLRTFEHGRARYCAAGVCTVAGAPSAFSELRAPHPPELLYAR
jgi:hypothetical protein